MIDKPIPAKILFHLINSKVTGEEFIGLSNSLYRQNLIFSEPQILRRNKKTIELTVVFRDSMSYNNWFNNSEIKLYWNKINKLLINKPKTIKETDIIIELDNVRNCTCNNSDFYILQGRSFQFVGELTCNKCFGEIPYSKIPLSIKLEDWQRKHERVYLNWIESSLFEQEALDELINYNNGKLNIEGEKIRKQLSDFFKLPIYLNLFIEEPTDNQQCPICNNIGNNSKLKTLKHICENCNTIF